MGILSTIQSWFGGTAEAAPTPATSPAPRAPENPAVVGVSGSSGDSKSVAAMMASLRAQGLRPVFLGDHAKRDVNKDFEQLDAVVVLGNNADIDPAKYGQAKHPATNIEADLARAHYEEALISKCLDAKKPLLGVCGGMQRLNVLGGGTLMQHVPDITGNNLHSQGDIPPFIPVQVVKMEAGTQLAAISEHASEGIYTPTHLPLPPNVSMENSMHHQAVDKVGADFVVAARSHDGIIEAIEPSATGKYANQYAIGVQWHPEFAASNFSADLIRDFGEHAQAFAKSHPSPHTLNEPEALRESAASSAPAIDKMVAEYQHPGAMQWQNLIRAQRESSAYSSRRQA